MKLNKVLEVLKILEEKSLKKGYRGDATSYAFQRHTLILLNEIAKGKKRKPSKYSLKVGQFMKEGKSIQEAHRLAKK